MTAQLDNINLAIGLSGMVLSLLGILLVRIGTMADKSTERYFLLSYLALLLFAGANLAGQLMRGHPGAGYRAALYVSNFIEFLSPVLLVYIVTLYLLFLLDPKGERLHVRTLFFALVLGHGTLLVISQFTGLYYVIDEANVYHRSEAYALSYLLPLVMMVMDIRLLFLDEGLQLFMLYISGFVSAYHKKSVLIILKVVVFTFGIVYQILPLRSAQILNSFRRDALSVPSQETQNTVFFESFLQVVSQYVVGLAVAFSACYTYGRTVYLFSIFNDRHSAIVLWLLFQ